MFNTLCKSSINSNVLLWSILEPHKLSANIRNILEKNEYPPFISIISLWEIAIKANIGRLTLPADFFSEVCSSDVTILNITPPHIETYLKLPLIHRDPFDRMLIAQANIEKLTIATSDLEIKKYDAAVVL